MEWGKDTLWGRVCAHVSVHGRACGFGLQELHIRTQNPSPSYLGPSGQWSLLTGLGSRRTETSIIALGGRHRTATAYSVSWSGPPTHPQGSTAYMEVSMGRNDNWVRIPGQEVMVE